MTRRVVLWRHGRTEWNVAGRVQGQTDTSLDDVGREQARAAAARLASLQPVRILSSDLERARDTAEELSRLSGVPVELDERLREMNFGEREGLTWRESWDRFPELMKAMLEDREERFPGAELHAEAGARLSEALGEALETLEDEQTLVVVAHGAVLRVGACTFLGFPEATWRTFAGLSNCSWIALEQISPAHGTRWRLTEWNAGTLPEPVMSDDE
ncbi:histidine phosphatase family protein [Aeromicrobium sp. 50.2.37]|uniref:histidine phosphatase family protein n=1 Tax=Aeromicrobium sp. 50.2.37 TaxID=2969305 RepID=UPI002150421D|nr:histidine phosphatase family protein [Aeromicrobium sp. 50.2.37]MCR4513144.1 histidine phosphatase family protein [Aeromicrobium sp. 50.2.37]